MNLIKSTKKEPITPGLLKAALVRMAISNFGKDYISYLEGEIKISEKRLAELSQTTIVRRYEEEMSAKGDSLLCCMYTIREYVELPKLIESLKQSLDYAKLIIAADNKRTSSAIKNKSLH